MLPSPSFSLFPKVSFIFYFLFLVRLFEGDSYSNGIVQTRLGGVWGSVCDKNWDENDAGKYSSPPE